MSTPQDTTLIGADPSHFYTFDGSMGRLKTRDGVPVVVLPEDVFAALLESASKANDLEVLTRIGVRFGQRALRELGKPADNIQPAEVAKQISHVMGIFGWGALNFTQQDRMMVVQLQNEPALSGAQRAGAALLEGLLSTLAGEPVGCVSAGSGQFLVLNPEVATRLKSLGPFELASTLKALR